NAKNLAAVDIEGAAVNALSVAQIAHGKNDLAALFRRVVLLAVEGGEITPHHHGDKTRRRKLLALQRAHIGAVAQHAASVGQAINLFHTVADVDDRDAFLLEIVDDLEELLRLPRRQRRRRLVHDDDTGVGAK